MPKKSKRYFAIRAELDSQHRHGVSEAVEKVKASATAKFDESIDAAVRLGVDPKHADQMVRGACSLPHGTGKSVRVLVFAQGEGAKAAEAAGARPTAATAAHRPGRLPVRALEGGLALVFAGCRWHQAATVPYRQQKRGWRFFGGGG